MSSTVDTTEAPTRTTIRKQAANIFARVINTLIQTLNTLPSSALSDLLYMIGESLLFFLVISHAPLPMLPHFFNRCSLLSPSTDRPRTYYVCHNDKGSTTARYLPAIFFILAFVTIQPFARLRTVLEVCVKRIVNSVCLALLARLDNQEFDVGARGCEGEIDGKGKGFGEEVSRAAAVRERRRTERVRWMQTHTQPQV